MHTMSGSNFVYSTQHKELCGECGRPPVGCVCARFRDAQLSIAGDGIVRVGRVTKGKQGNGVTTVTGLRLGEADLKALAKRLKQSCGTGGTVKAGVIEIQGEHRDKLVRELQALGHTVKRAGG